MVETMSRGANVLSNMPDHAEPLPKAAGAVDLPKVKEILASGEFTQHDLDSALAHAVWYGGRGGVARRARRSPICSSTTEPIPMANTVTTTARLFLAPASA